MLTYRIQKYPKIETLDKKPNKRPTIYKLQIYFQQIIEPTSSFKSENHNN